MEEHEFLLVRSEYEEKSSFLYKSFDSLDSDFLEYFEYVPLTKDNLHVSSMRLAGFILRIFPLLSIAFRTFFWGTPMRLFLRNIGRNESSEFVEKFIRKMKRLYKKKKENTDTIWDYYRFLNQKTIRGMLREEKISKSAVFARNRIGSIDFQEPIQPFIGKTWDHLVGNRHSIEHRGQIYSSVEDSLYSFACLAIILRENSERQIEQYHDFNSKLFEIESQSDIFRMHQYYV